MEDDAMAALDQPCQELQNLDIFRPDIIEGVKELYYPIFEKIRIYGTVNEPVFVAKDVQDALGLKNIRYKDDDVFDWNTERIKIKIQTRGGAQQVIALTEQGLYKAVWHSKVEIAKKFQVFMTCVMKRLRITGDVTIEQAIQDYKEKIAWLEQRDKALNMQMDIEHKELVRLRIRDENREMVLYNQCQELYNAKRRLEYCRDPDANLIKERYERAMQRYGRVIYVSLCRPPKEHEETYNYEFDSYPEGDEDLIDPSETMIWSVGLKKMESRTFIKKVYIHKTIKLEDLQDALKTYRLEKTDKRGNSAGYYTNHYEISLEILDTVVDDLNRKEEESNADEA